MEKISEQVNTIFQSIPFIMKYPSSHTWIDYDKEADVLYINFAKGQRATDSIMQDDVLVRQRLGKVIGLTIMNVSKFQKRRLG